MRPPREVVEQLREGAEQTGLFTRLDGFKDLICLIDRAFTDAEVGALIAWCESVEQAIREQAGEPAPG